MGRWGGQTDTDRLSSGIFIFLPSFSLVCFLEALTLVVRLSGSRVSLWHFPFEDIQAVAKGKDLLLNE